MKLYKSILKNLLPDLDVDSVRSTLDLLGLEVKGVDPDFYTIEILANRGDHLSHINIAKELSLKLNLKLVMPTIYEGNLLSKHLIGELSSLTSVFSVCHLRVTPFSRLELPVSFESSVNFLVNLANYVMIETGQPLHCYSAKKVTPPFKTIQMAGSLDALDGKNYSFPLETVFVCDQSRCVAAGGIIGSIDSALDSSDFEIFLEAACFDPIAVRKSRSFAKIQTEASFYFERSVASDLQEFSVRRFLSLLDENGIKFEVLGFEIKKKSNGRKTVLLSQDSVKRHFQEVVDFNRALFILEKLDFSVLSRSDDGATLQIPPKRYFNVEFEEDVIQEVARFVDFNNVPKPELSFSMDYNSDNVLELKRTLSQYLTSHGFYEIVTKVFINSAEESFLRGHGLEEPCISIKNSCESQYAYLRSEAFLSIAKAIVKNINNFIVAPKVFEFGKTFSYKHGERSALYFGYPIPCFDSNQARKDYNVSLDFGTNLLWSIVNIVWEGLLDDFSVRKIDKALFQFGIVGEVKNQQIFTLGVLSPSVLQFIGSPVPIVIGEINYTLRSLNLKYIPNDVIDFPKTYRDINVSSSGSTVFNKFCEVLKRFPEVVSWQVVDRYHDNVTVRLYFRSKDSTLSNERVDNLIAQICGFLFTKQ